MAYKAKIAPSKVAWGVKLPCESSKVGKGYTANGPVKTYTLPPEEIERIFARAKKPEGKPPIRWKDPSLRKGDTNMTRLNTARELLTKEQYIAIKERGMSDKEIMLEVLHVDNWGDVLAILKREWGIEGMFPRYTPKKKDVPTPESEPVPVEPETLPNDPASENYDPRQPIADWTPEQPKLEHHQELSLIDAIKLKDQLTAEVECADYLIDPETIAVTAGIKVVLETYRCECATKLKRLEDVLGRITVTI